MLRFHATANLSQVSQQMASQSVTEALVENDQAQPIGIISLKLLNQLIAAELKHGGDLPNLFSKTLDQIYPDLEPITASYQQESDLFRLAIELNHIGCWHFDLVTKTAEWNHILYQLLGLNQSVAANYQTWNQSIHPDDRERVIQAFDQAIANHQELEIRHRILQPSGQQLWLLTRGITLYDHQDQPVTMVGICVDITDAHQIRLRLEQSEQEISRQNQTWQQTLDSITEGFISLDHNWQITHVNAAASLVTGVSQGELIGGNFWDLFPSCYNNQFGAIYQQAMSTKTYQELTDFYPYFKAYLQVRVFPSELGISLFVKDLTDTHRLKLERDLLFTHSPWIMLISDHEGKIRQLNPAWQRILGYTLEESLDRPFTDFLHPDEVETTIAHTLHLYQTNQPSKSYQVRYMTKSGEVKWLSWDCIPFPLENKIYAFGRDVTGRKLAEDALLQVNQSLEQQVADRTLELNKTVNYLRAIIKLQNLFIAQSFEQALPQVLQTLGELTNSSRAFLFQNNWENNSENNWNDKFTTSQIAEWCAPGIPPQISNLALQQMGSEQLPPHWAETLSQGKFFYAQTANIREPYQSPFTAQQIQSILDFPIQSQGQWWGFLGFDQCDQVKIWTESEITLLQAVASTIGLAIERQIVEHDLIETARKLNENMLFTQSIATATPSMIYIFDLETRTPTYLNRPHYLELGYDPQAMPDDPLSCLHPDDRIAMKDHLAKLRQANPDQIYSIEYRMRLPDQQYRWYFSQDRVFKRNSEGQVEQIIGAATNISDRKQIEQQIAQFLQEKEVLLQELNHRVKNNLNLIKSLVVLTAQRITDPIAKTQLNHLQTQIMIIDEVHHLLCSRDQLDSINLGDYINTLTNNFSSLYSDRPIKFELQTIPVKTSTSTAICLGLILNELIVNATKYAFHAQTPGVISVKLTHDQDGVYLSVSDNGVGSSDLDSTPGTGLGIIKLLLKQLKGKFSHQTQPHAHGSHIQIQVPHSV